MRDSLSIYTFRTLFYILLSSKNSKTGKNFVVEDAEPHTKATYRPTATASSTVSLFQQSGRPCVFDLTAITHKLIYTCSYTQKSTKPPPPTSLIYILKNLFDNICSVNTLSKISNPAWSLATGILIV